MADGSLSSCFKKKEIFSDVRSCIFKGSNGTGCPICIFRKGKSVGHGSHKDCCGSRYINRIPPRNYCYHHPRLPLPICPPSSACSTSNGHWHFEIIVARIAYVASDVVLSVQPALGVDSEFSAHLHRFAANKAPGLVGRDIPEVRHPAAGHGCFFRTKRNTHFHIWDRYKLSSIMSILSSLPSSPFGLAS